MLVKCVLLKYTFHFFGLLLSVVCSVIRPLCEKNILHAYVLTMRFLTNAIIGLNVVWARRATPLDHIGSIKYSFRWPGVTFPRQNCKYSLRAYRHTAALTTHIQINQTNKDTNIKVLIVHIKIDKDP